MTQTNRAKEKVQSCVKLFSQVTGDADPIESWLNFERKVERFGVDFVFNEYFDLKGFEGDYANFKWCIAAVIHEYVFGSDEFHEIRAVNWLLGDLVHAGQGNFSEFIAEHLEPHHKICLTEFAREIGCYTLGWGFNTLGADSAHSLAWLFQQSACTNLIAGHAKERVAKPICGESFRLYKFSKFNNPIIFMDFEDALLFALASLVVIEPNRLFAEPNSMQIVHFIEEIYDQYVSEDELETLESYKAQLLNGDSFGSMLIGFEFNESEIYETYPERRDQVLLAIEHLIQKSKRAL